MTTSETRLQTPSRCTRVQNFFLRSARSQPPGGPALLLVILKCLFQAGENFERGLKNRHHLQFIDLRDVLAQMGSNSWSAFCI
jgi:hypothetical protein